MFLLLNRWQQLVADPLHLPPGVLPCADLHPLGCLVKHSAMLRAADAVIALCKKRNEVLVACSRRLAMQGRQEQDSLPKT